MQARVANGRVTSIDVIPMEPASDLLAVRRQKLDALRAAGVAPFGRKFEVEGRIEDVLAAFSEGKAIRAAGAGAGDDVDPLSQFDVPAFLRRN